MKSFLIKLLFVGCISVLFLGCQSTQETAVQETAKVFYPPTPDIPRLQFLKSISNTDDLGPQAETVSGFEKFIVGADEKKTEWISKPYGIAFYDSKIYICDVDKKRVKVIDLKNNTIGDMTKDRRLVNPVDLYIDRGMKYVADNKAGAVFVFGRDDQLRAVLGQELGIQPIDVAVHGNRCYVADKVSNQVVVLDKTTGKELSRIGSVGDEPGQFMLIAGLTLDADENVYVTDKGLARVSKFNKEGIFQMTFGKMGDTVYDFARPKGIALDKANRLWIVDAAPQVTKIYDPQGQLLMFFGFPGGEPGNMNLPVTVIIDYDHIDLFSEDIADGANIEFLVLVANQYGEKINVYGFGQFPVQEKERAEAETLLPEPTEESDDIETQEMVEPVE